MVKRCVLGIDIGGTKVKLAPVFDNGKMGEKATFAVPQKVTPENLADLILKATLSVCPPSEYQITAVGAGCPGHVSNDRRTILDAPNLQWKNVPFAEKLEKKFGVPVVLENDVNAAALGEYYHGSGKGTKNLICVFVGTGVGGGIIIDDKLLRGNTGNAAEVGHMIFSTEPTAPLCSCGRKGCVEGFAGGAHITKRYYELSGEKVSNAVELWKLAKKGDRHAVRVTSNATSALVTLLVNLQTLFDTEKIVLGGGIIEHVCELFTEIKKNVTKYMVGQWDSKVSIEKSKFGADSAIIGCAASANENARVN